MPSPLPCFFHRDEAGSLRTLLSEHILTHFEQAGWALAQPMSALWNARDAASATSMIYIMRHVRFIQQVEHDGETRAHQIEGELNPPDALTKWLAGPDRRRHYLFMMGYPDEARAMWESSTKYKNYKPKKIIPVSELETEKATQSES